MPRLQTLLASISVGLPHGGVGFCSNCWLHVVVLVAVPAVCKCLGIARETQAVEPHQLGLPFVCLGSAFLDL